jgi:GTPase Era involved in 16S rRNA processing
MNLAVLEGNFARLKKELRLVSGKQKVALLGQPGAGKSTLLDLITDRGAVPRPVIGPRTDATDWSESSHAQLLHSYRNFVFVDAPGYDTSAHPVEAFLAHFPFEKFDRLVLAVKGKIHEADDRVLGWLKRKALAERTLVARSFSEGLSAQEEDEIRAELNTRFDGPFVLFSNRELTGLERIRKFIGMNANSYEKSYD